MEVIRGGAYPKRLTEIYTDTKTCYEKVFQLQDPLSQSSSVYRKLRVQKDRLIAWGLEWGDTKATSAGDIDESLDRAGISDLVASIMTSIKELLDDAERIRFATRKAFTAFPSEKAGSSIRREPHWSPSDSARLDDIVKDLTTSIDTLCDLSRSRRERRQASDTSSQKKSNLASKELSKSDLPSFALDQRQSRSTSRIVSASVPRCYLNLDNEHEYLVECHFEQGPSLELSRSYQDFYELQVALLGEFPLEAGQGSRERTLPYMPGPVAFVTDEIAFTRRESLDLYLKDLLKLPSPISQCQTLHRFLSCRQGDIEIKNQIFGAGLREADELSSTLHQKHLGKSPIGHSHEMSTGYSQDSKLRLSKTRSLDIVASTHIHPNQIRFAEVQKLESSSPPPYESVAAGTDRVLGYVGSSEQALGLDDEQRVETPVLLEYGSIHDTDPNNGHSPVFGRYEELADALNQSGEGKDAYKQGFLNLIGWSADPRQPRYAFIYELPRVEASSVHINTPVTHTLLSLLQHAADTDSSNMPSLEDRFRLAFNLAFSFLRLHSKGSTHRNVNSNNILFFNNDAQNGSTQRKFWKDRMIRHPYLTSFDQCSQDSHNGIQEPNLETFYRHPQMKRGERSTYRQAHDIYSLGLILLEIGLWMPISKFCKARYTRSDLKSRLQSIYSKKLAAKCGTGYMRAVEYCLTAADNDADILDNESYIQGGVRSRMEFSCNVVKPLERCCMIEDGNVSPESPEIQNVLAKRASTNSLRQQYFVQGKSPLPSTEQDHPSKASAQLREAETAVQGKTFPLPNMLNIPPNLSTESQGSPNLKDMLSHEGKAERQIPALPTPAKPKFRIWSYELPTSHLTYWNSTMFPQLDRILNKVIDRWESCSIELCMSGDTREGARPTIYMMCNSIEKARKALKHVNKEKQLFDIKVVRGAISRSKAGKKRRKRPARKSDKTKGSEPAVATEIRQLTNPHHQKKPSCGASIGAFRENEHLGPVSFGGTVLVGGKPFGMSVHHMLDNENVDLGLDDDLDLTSSMAPRLDDSTFEGSWCPNEIPEALYPFEISEDEDEGYTSSIAEDEPWIFEDNHEEDYDRDGSYKPDDEDITMGDLPGVDPGEGEELIITQPAIDDVEDGFFPSEDDKDEEHISCHTFGHIYASSGIRRTSKNHIKHEVDWALIEVNEERLRDHNLVSGGKRHCRLATQQHPAAPTGGCFSLDDTDLYPCNYLGAETLGGRPVHALGRTSGLQTGVILPAMSLVKMPGRTSFSHSWQVMGGFGVGGDSGAWIIDNNSGHVCGHVLAWSSKSGVAYLSPMEVLLHDMENVLGAHVELPGSQGRSEERDGEELEHTTVLTNSLKISDLAADAQDDDSTEIPGTPDLSSPLLPTSPPTSSPPTRSNSSVYLTNTAVQTHFPDTNILRHINTDYRTSAKQSDLTEYANVDKSGVRPLRSKRDGRVCA